MKGILALLDVLLCHAALIVEPHHPVWLHRQVGDDEAHTGEELTWMPFDLRDDATVRRRMIWSSCADFGAEGAGSSGLGYAA
jgi:hypothetical protein